MYENWFIVKKSFRNSGGKLLTPGDPVFTEGWRNTKNLEESDYIRKPAGEDEFKKIQAAIDAKKKQVTPDNKGEIKKEPPKGEGQNLKRG